MEWWNSVVEWFGSREGQLVVYGAIIPFVAIVVAAVVASLVARSAIRRLVQQRERETRSAAVAALIATGEAAAQWHAQPPQTREHFERLASQADVQVRLLPLSGAALAADWAAHELADMRTNSVSFSFQADQTLTEYRDRLVEWMHRPGRARKLFGADLERWRYERSTSADPIVLQQQQWAEEQFTAATNSTPERSADRRLPAADAAGVDPAGPADRGATDTRTPTDTRTAAERAGDQAEPERSTASTPFQRPGTPAAADRSDDVAADSRS